MKARWIVGNATLISVLLTLSMKKAVQTAPRVSHCRRATSRDSARYVPSAIVPIRAAPRQIVIPCGALHRCNARQPRRVISMPIMCH